MEINKSADEKFDCFYESVKSQNAYSVFKYYFKTLAMQQIKGIRGLVNENELNQIIEPLFRQVYTNLNSNTLKTSYTLEEFFKENEAECRSGLIAIINAREKLGI